MTLNSAYPIPTDRLYDGENHIWAKYDDNSNQVVVGVDTLNLASMGDLAYVSFQPKGTEVKAGESIGVIEAAKMTGDIISPISGTIVDFNEDSLRDPMVVNNDPYGAGWLVKIEPTDWAGESKKLLADKAIVKWAEAEITRFRAQGWID